MQTVTGVKCIDTDQVSITTSGIQVWKFHGNFAEISLV
jgi:hypothetical protein